MVMISTNKNIAALLLVLFSIRIQAQLLPGIGLSSLPAGSASICAEPFYSGGFYTSGFQVGDTVPDFKLYGLTGDSLVLSQALSAGKPALLIGGNLTCPVFRAKVATINQVISSYSSSINGYVIYTLEAHPTDTSVYFGYVNVTSQNTTAGILFPQAKTYAERKALVDTMSAFVSLTAPVFIDGPCNNWWRNFGPAPNNSYLIGMNGVVLNKHGWFHKFPDNIFCDLDSILSMNSGLCIPPPTIPGSFSLTIINTGGTGMPGEVVYDYVDIVNTTSVSTVIKVKKLQTSIPAGWQTMFCADVCYAATEDSIEVSVDPHDTLHFSLDFATDAIPDSGKVRVGFKNVNKTNNSFSLWLSANTTFTAVALESYNSSNAGFGVYPNPSTGQVTILADGDVTSVSIRDLAGKELPVSRSTKFVDTSQLPNGIYFLSIRSAKGQVIKKLVVDRQ